MYAMVQEHKWCKLEAPSLLYLWDYTKSKIKAIWSNILFFLELIFSLRNESDLINVITQRIFLVGTRMYILYLPNDPDQPLN